MKKILLTNFHPHQDGGGGHARYIRTILESGLRKDFEFGVAAPEGSGVWATGRALSATTFACPFPGHLTRLRKLSAPYAASMGFLRNGSPTRSPPMAPPTRTSFGFGKNLTGATPPAGR